MSYIVFSRVPGITLMDENNVITLIGSRLAKPGAEFIFRGAAADCEKCKLKNSCVNLEKNKKYRVVNARTGLDHECLIHDECVRAVVVTPCPVVVAIESRKAFNGSKLVYEAPQCEKECPEFEACHPMGLANGEKYTISDVLGDVVNCRKGLTLKKVELRP